MTATERLPAAFLGHGSPMNALSENAYTAAWRSLGERLPRPRAIVVVSAHWYINATAVTSMSRPRTIHDFYGFPQELFDVEYPAPGDPGVADEIAEIAKPLWVGLDHDSWGIDHGTWSVLVHCFPEADIPVVQLSINAEKPLEYHLDLGARLAPLRDDGIFFVASGNVVHNLAMIDPSLPTSGFDWAERFHDAARELVTSGPGDIGRLQEHPDFRRAVPAPDHFIPLLYLAGLAAADGDGSGPEVLVDGYAYGSLSMDSYTLGLARNGAAPDPSGSASASLPDSDVIPADQTNA